MKDQLKLLIIDDDAADRVLIQRALKSSGWEVEISMACEAQEGIQKAETLKPHVIVMDGCMPGMDGFDVCRKIRAMDHHCKIVICTGAIDAVIIDKAKKVGADECCLKSADYKLFIDILQQRLFPTSKNTDKENVND